MLRELRTNGAKAASTMYRAETEMNTGMGVVKKETALNKMIGFPIEETAENLYFVNKENLPTGLNCARGEMSDYDDNFVKIVSNELIKIEKYTEDEKFITDQYVAADFTEDTPTGFVISVGTDGLVKKASDSITSRYEYCGLYKDNGHTLVIIEVLDTPRTNAV